MEINQYQIITVNFDPKVGSEIKKTRPYIVISPNEMNRQLSTIVIAPITSTKKNYPTRVKISIKERVGRIALDQIRTIDKSRIIKVENFITLKEIIQVKSILQRTYID